MPLELDNDGRRLLGALADLMPRIVPADPQTYPTYKELHGILSLPFKGGTWGRSLQLQGLNNLGDWSGQERARIPPITGLIVAQATRRPSAGFFVLYGVTASSPAEQDQWWLGQMPGVVAFDWTRWR